jgi:phosphatidylinositol alpha-1,6-mannosyltransferase
MLKSTPARVSEHGRDEMKFLYLGTDLHGKGGIPRYSRFQIRALREAHGSESVQVLCLNPIGDDPFEQPLEVRWIGRGVSAPARLEFVGRAIASALRFRPDVVFANHLALAPAAVLAAKAGRGRCIVNVYGREAWTGMRPRDRWGFERANHVISDCHSTASYVHDELRIPKERLSVVWDCVDLDCFAPGPLDEDVASRYGVPIRQGEMRLMTLGRVSRTSRHKGYERMLEVVAAIPRELRPLYVIAGTGDFVPELRQRTSQLGIDDRVIFTGSIHEDHMAAVYRCCDVFCLVSDRGEGRGEGIPLTPLEAAACGIPILVGNQDGSQEAVLEGYNGYILDPFDISGIAEKVVDLTKNTELRRQLGSGARKRVEAEHSFPIFKERTLEAVQIALDQAPAQNKD